MRYQGSCKKPGRGPAEGQEDEGGSAGDQSTSFLHKVTLPTGLVFLDFLCNDVHKNESSVT